MNKGTSRQALALLGAPALLALLSWSWVSAQVPVAGAVPSGPTRIEESDPTVVYTGVWYPQRRSDLSGGSIVESPYPISTASLTFIGTGVRRCSLSPDRTWRFFRHGRLREPVARPVAGGADRKHDRNLDEDTAGDARDGPEPPLARGPLHPDRRAADGRDRHSRLLRAAQDLAGRAEQGEEGRGLSDVERPPCQGPLPRRPSRGLRAGLMKLDVAARQFAARPVTVA